VAVLPQELIRIKRDGGRLADADVDAFVQGIVSGAVTEGQAAAFAMAVYFNGLDIRERVALTQAMTASGTTLSWDLSGPVLDKHSTGGVGDTVSLMLAPMVAACGGYVPMISGRGLGHTGGTYDKFESIPGYQAAPSMTKFRNVVAKVGCAVIGQTADLAPADKRLYGIRDVTATVESIGLITASILSKKLAAGLDGLAMDVKYGNGAFMATKTEATKLARSIVKVANGAGLPCTAVLTAMDQPLGSAAGNAVEIALAIDYLTGTRRDPRLHEVTIALCTEMLLLGGLATTADAARTKLNKALDSGAAAEKFAQMVKALGGPAKLIDTPWKFLPRPAVTVGAYADDEAYVAAIDTRAVGMAVVVLGGGRTRPQDPVDHAVGLTELAAIGDRVGPDRPLALIHATSADAADAAAAKLGAAYTLGPKPGRSAPVVSTRITGSVGDQPAPSRRSGGER